MYMYTSLSGLRLGGGGGGGGGHFGDICVYVYKQWQALCVYVYINNDRHSVIGH